MKNIFFILLLLMSLQVLAKSDPLGLFQVDSKRSVVVVAGEAKKISGFIDLKEDFLTSKFNLESDNSSFESTEVSGGIEDFEVKGTLISGGESREITLKGHYFGLNDRHEDYQHLVLKLSGENCDGNLYALKPQPATGELHKVVQELVR